jgi:hypothetical protein
MPDKPTPAHETGDPTQPPQSLPEAGPGAPAPVPPRVVRVPSRRLTAVLAAGMLAAGVAVGAAIGPAPTASFAGAGLPAWLPALIAKAASSGGSSSAPGSGSSPTSAPEATARRRRRRHRRAVAAAGASETAAPAAAEAAPESSSPAGSGKEGSKGASAPLPPVTKVWIVELDGAGFGEALASSAGAPYTDSQAIPQGALLSGWSALQGGAFAQDAALIATTEPQIVQTIVQPPCPEGAAGASCAAGTPGALKTADEFLAQTLPKLTASPLYKTNGLIVVTFGSIASGAASELPAGSTTATLSSRPPAGVLLISPFVTAGKRPTTTFNPTTPRQSLEALLHR